MNVVWSRQALLDLENIHDYIASDNPIYAKAFVERLLHTTRHLPQFPLSGRIMPESKNITIRELIYQGYRIIYCVQSNSIQIITVVHGSRDLNHQSDL
jgi:addiction module RelE/StbE family toxin